MSLPGPAAARRTGGGISNNAVFKSVFDVEPIQPTKKRDTDERKDQSGIYRQVQRQASDSAKALLGIGTEGWVWGRNLTTRHGEPFRCPLLQCKDAARLRLPEGEDIQLERQKFRRSTFCQTLPQWQSQLGSPRLEKLLAEVLNGLISSYVTVSYKGVLIADVGAHLHYWVSHVLRLFIHWTRLRLSGDGAQAEGSEFLKESGSWYESALTRLGALRVEELFSVVANGDATGIAVTNVVEDLRSFATNPATRTYLTDHFITDLVNRALQPGAATIDILRLYISTIRALGQLDPKGILLDRVARYVRRYLRERDDTVRVIVGGLLSEPEAERTEDVLVEIAQELKRSSIQGNNSINAELDWDNMDWVPDPVDAAPDYLKSDAVDVMGSLTSLFESKEIFVKELQALLGDRLLLSKGSYEHEVQVLDHLKARFGDSALQACEVMLRDVLESSRVDALITGDLRAVKIEAPLPRMHAKVLSRLFWPTMSEQTFEMPEVVQKAQRLYEKTFEHVKQSRQISWVPSLGQIKVELELEDRTVVEEVLPYQAAVIYAFQSAPGAASTRTVSALASRLTMTAALVRSACIFWVSKRVLAENSVDTFAVLETLPDGSDVIMAEPSGKQEASAAAAEAAAAQAAKEAEEEERKQKMAIYHQFIVSMLTNQGAMPLPRIAMMLNIVVPGGFPFSSEELKEFLTGMVKDGQLEVGPGGNYKAMT
jgi:anaphase-promoting complex subunit 2